MASNWKVTGSMRELMKAGVVYMANLARTLSHVGIGDPGSKGCRSEICLVASSVMNRFDSVGGH